jgi:hypothetical protein
MRKISDAVREIVENDPGLKAGLSQGLMNLSQVARHIHAAVEARTQKPVRTDAIAMSLSRLRAHLPALDDSPGLHLADRITVQRGLAVLTWPNTTRVLADLARLGEVLRTRGRYVTLTEGIREVTLIVEEASLDTVGDTVGAKPSRLSRGIASLSVSLTQENLATPGILYRLLQPLALQGVNLAEVASTTTEFHVYIDEADVLLALESLYATFR